MPKFLHEFVKYNGGTTIDNGWWKIVGDRLVNFNGGYHYYTPSPNDIIVEADSFNNLDWSCLLKNKSNYGWLSRDGKFYGCDFQEHSLVAEYVLKASERELEEAGWVKIFRDYPYGIGWFCANGRITELQKDFLIERCIYEKT